MKRFVVAIVLLICVVAESFFINFFVEKAIAETQGVLLLCTEKEKSTSLDVMKIKTALNTWEKNKKILYTFMFHDDFSETEKNMVTLRYLSEFPEFGEIERICRETAMMLDNMRNKFCVNFENIF